MDADDEMMMTEKKIKYCYKKYKHKMKNVYSIIMQCNKALED